MTDEEWTASALDPTPEVAGAHYDLKSPTGSFESIDVLEAVVSRESLPRPVAYCIGNALKYLLRAGNKPGVSWWDDLAKAENYLHRARTGAWMNTKQKESI